MARALTCPVYHASDVASSDITDVITVCLCNDCDAQFTISDQGRIASSAALRIPGEWFAADRTRALAVRTRGTAAVPVGAEHAAVAGFRPEHGAASGTLVKEQAAVQRHHLIRLVPALRARQRRRPDRHVP
jgi:hypothetical protein